jgi:hypothetical protein
MIQEIALIELYYEKLKACGSTSGRASNGYKIIEILNDCPKARQFWRYEPNARFWVDRFQKVEVKMIKYEAPPIFKDDLTNLRNAPEVCGLYFIGETHFNPITDEKFYCVKIGLSNNIKKRMNNYRSCTSMVYPIEFLDASNYEELERYYHNLLNKVATYRNQNNEEYWFVDRETYLAMCEQGFSYFED